MIPDRTEATLKRYIKYSKVEQKKKKNKIDSIYIGGGNGRDSCSG